MQDAIDIDVLIFGGGIAGLWTLARLRREGYSCVLVESKALGSGQTIASQGIIHGGIKYALTGQASAASKAIAEMPGIWRACLEGRGEIDLRGAKVLSEKQYLWTTPGIGSRIAGVAASKVIRTAVRSVPKESRIAPFDAAPRGVDVYEVEEPVLDPVSLLSCLRSVGTTAWRRTHSDTHEIIARDDQQGWSCQLAVAREDARQHPWEASAFRARALVLCAGERNAAMLDWALGSTAGQTKRTSIAQVRPLHMVMLRAQDPRDPLPMVYGHCVGMSDKPRVTITSQKDAAGGVVWYVGGSIAESGTERGRDEQIAAARDEITASVPWVDIRGAQWATLRVNRAEGIQGEAGHRPDGPVIESFDRVHACWPTKLAFAPLVASMVHDRLRETDIVPSGRALSPAILDVLTPPPVADLPWNDRSIAWT